MAASRILLLFCIVALPAVGCHLSNPSSQQPGAAPLAPTATAEKAQIHSDQTAAQSTMQSDAAALRSAMAGPTTATDANGPIGPIAVAHIMPSKSATTMPANNDVSGTVSFTQIGKQVLVVADISGLEPNTRHGIHIHERGDLSDPGLLSAGGHWNPDHHIHGGPTTSPVHAGDLGNLDADATGHAHLELTLSNVSVGGMKNDVIGHSVIIHAKADDLISQPSGNSGARVAGGIIELQTAPEH